MAMEKIDERQHNGGGGTAKEEYEIDPHKQTQVAEKRISWIPNIHMIRSNVAVRVIRK